MTRTGSEPGDFDRWLHRQLCVALEPERGPRPHPADARYAAVARRTGGQAILTRSSIPAALGAKALVGGAVVALAAGTAGTVMTGSVNPANWGQHVSEAVETCAKDVNVGRCVSAFAQEHGEAVRAQHSEAVENGKSPEPSQREGQETPRSSNKGGNGAAASAGHSQGQAQGHETPAPSPSASDHGHARPSPHA